MTTWTEQFGSTPVQVSRPSYRAISFSANTTLVWPESQTTSSNIVAFINDCTPSTGSLALTMPDATQVGAGRDCLFVNVGASSFTLKDSAGGTITTVATSTSVYLYLTDNSTAAGSWRVTVFGATTSGADANALDGNGLTVISNLLNTAHPVTSTSTTPTTLAASDRAKLIVWTGGAGTFNLTAAATLGDNWFALIANQGSGVLTIDGDGSETIDGDTTKALQQDESLFIVCNGSNFFSVGYGRAVASTVTRLSKSVAGSTDVTLTASEAANTLLAFTGALTGNINVIVPTSVAIYDVYNNTTGAFTLTVKTSAGTGIDVPQSTRTALYSDGTNVVSENDPYRLVNAQTGLTYTVLNSDRGKLITHTNGSAIAVTLPQAGGSAEFTKGWFAYVQNRGAGAVTYTPTTSTIDGAASLVINQNQGFALFSDGTNYFTFRGIGFTDPMTTRGDMIYRAASAAARLAIGAANSILGTDGTDPIWRTAAAALVGLVTTRGDLITRNATDVIRLAVGGANTVLKSDGTDPAWGSIVTANITDANVTYAKIQDVSAASRLLGRGSAAGSGDVEEITIGSGLSLSGTSLSSAAVNDLVVVQDQKAANTAGNAYTSGAWRTVILTTEVTDTGSIASLASNAITLAAGSYEFDAYVNAGYAAGGSVNIVRLRLQNTSDASTIIQGVQNSMIPTGGINEDVGETTISINGVFTIAATKTIELQVYPLTSNTIAARAMNNGSGELYATIKLRRYAT